MMKSELGILYLSEHNREVIERMLVANELVRSRGSSLPRRMSSSAPTIRWRPLQRDARGPEDHPFLSYEQGSYNSFYYSEELTSTFERAVAKISACDRATLFNLAMGLNGYTVCSGRDQPRAQRPRHYLDSARRGRSTWRSASSRAKYDAYALWSGLYRRDSSAYPGCCVPHGSSLFMTVQTDIGSHLYQTVINVYFTMVI